MKKESLNTIKKMYERGENIIRYLKDNEIKKNNSDEMIMISYDFQSGSYIKDVKENFEFNEKYTRAISKVINNIGVEYDSILEAGVGEATTLANLIPKLAIKPKNVYGFDLAWSRIRFAKEYIEEKKIFGSHIFVGNLFNIPLADSSIDVVYTSHSIEPNGGREKEALLELFRVSKKYLVLIEPAYEFASTEAQKRMERHGYIKNLYSTAVSIGLNIVEHSLFDVCSNHLNPTGILIIKKEFNDNRIVSNPFICPVTKTTLELIKNSYFTKDGLLVYPIIDGVPILLKEHAVVATHFTDDFKIINRDNDC
ncbi:MAG: methyltransferase domain-containing protein [Patescibacteria group bacterium]